MSKGEDDPRSRIETARRDIDAIDDRLVELLNRRAERVGEIGRAKRRLDEPIYQPDREEEIFARVRTQNRGPLDDEALRRLFERILDEARRLERLSYRDEHGRHDEQDDDNGN